MKLLIYSVYDSKAKTFSQPFFSNAAGSALRSFQDIANDKNHPIGAHPEDYTLFEIGEFDDSIGTPIPYEKHTNYGLASSYVKPIITT